MVTTHISSPASASKPANTSDYLSKDGELDDNLLQLIMTQHSKGKGIDINTLMSQPSVFKKGYEHKPKDLKPLPIAKKNKQGWIHKPKKKKPLPESDADDDQDDSTGDRSDHSKDHTDVTAKDDDHQGNDIVEDDKKTEDRVTFMMKTH